MSLDLLFLSSAPFLSLQFFQTGTIMGQRFDCGMATPSPTWYPVFLLVVGSISSLSLLLAILSKVPLFESWDCLTSQVSGAFWRVLPTSYLEMLPVSILSAGFQGFNPFPSLLIRFSSLPLPLYTFLPRSLSPFPLVIAFFSLQSGTEESSLGPFSLLTFLSSVEYILSILYSFPSNIHLLVSIYHACPFGSEFSHSGYFLVPSICWKTHDVLIFNS
jgi:hypothetical protein